MFSVAAPLPAETLPRLAVEGHNGLRAGLRKALTKASCDRTLIAQALEEYPTLVSYEGTFDTICVQRLW
jgi:PIN domain nuclease of toxin-antitoxin system